MNLNGPYLNELRSGTHNDSETRHCFLQDRAPDCTAKNRGGIDMGYALAPRRPRGSKGPHYPCVSLQGSKSLISQEDGIATQHPGTQASGHKKTVNDRHARYGIKNASVFFLTSLHLGLWRLCSQSRVCGRSQLMCTIGSEM